MPLFDSSDVFEIDEKALDEARLAVPEGGQLLEIRPYKESDRGMKDNIEMYRAFHNRSKILKSNKWNENGFSTSPINSFEIWYDGESLRFMVYIENDDDLRRGIRHISSNFPSARIIFPSESYNPVPLPNVETSKYMVGTEFGLKKHFYAPIRNPEGARDFHGQYRNILANMTNQEDVTEVIQVLFRAAGKRWTSSRYTDAVEYADNISGRASGDSSRPLSRKMRYAERNIKSQIGQPGFYVTLRVLAFGDDKDALRQQRNDLSHAFNEYYREITGQTFKPMTRHGGQLQRLLEESAARKGRYMDWPRGPKQYYLRNETRTPVHFMVMTPEELAGLAHIPNEEHLETSAVNWVVLDSSNRLPSQAPKYEEQKQDDTEDIPPWEDASLPWEDDDDEGSDGDDDSDDTPETPDPPTSPGAP